MSLALGDMGSQDAKGLTPTESQHQLRAKKARAISARA